MKRNDSNWQIGPYFQKIIAHPVKSIEWAMIFLLVIYFTVTMQTRCGLPFDAVA